jgi:hypothetical protein
MVFADEPIRVNNFIWQNSLIQTQVFEFLPKLGTYIFNRQELDKALTLISGMG